MTRNTPAERRELYSPARVSVINRKMLIKQKKQIGVQSWEKYAEPSLLQSQCILSCEQNSASPLAAESCLELRDDT